MLAGGARAADAEDWRALVASGQLVEVTRYDPTILVEMRYATGRNGTGAALYPPDFPCLVRPAVALRLRWAQTFLRARCANGERYVSNPDKGRGSLHTQGLAVDVTLVDAHGKEVLMPSEFDKFDATAAGIYTGKSEVVASNLKLLQFAMMHAGGFSGLSFEWWHFVDRDWRRIKPFDEKP